MKKELDFRSDLKKRLKDKSFRRAFEEEKIYAELAVSIAKIREKEGLTQQELARAINTTQQNISRIEDPDNESLTLATLIRIARALHKHLQIKFS